MENETLTKIIGAIGIKPVCVSDETARMLQIQHAISYLWREFTNVYFSTFVTTPEAEDKANKAINDFDEVMWQMITDNMWQNNVMEKEILI